MRFCLKGDHLSYFIEYDELQRPTSAWVKKGSDTPLLVNYTVYGEKHPNAANLNLRGQVYEQFDQSGVVINDEFDFKGNPLHGTRQIAKDYKTTKDWSVLNGLTDIQDIASAAASLLEPESFTSSTEYDALNRPVKMTTPDNSNIRPSYNEANFPEKVEVQLRGATEWTPFVNNINYDEKGQRVLIEYGNNVKTEYRYDDETFRLQNLKTTRDSGSNPLQDLSYAYDPAGNITSIRDEALQTIYFNNEAVSPSTKYTYDALYRLVEAKGREHIGQSGNNLPEHKPEHKPHYDFNDSTRKNLTHPNEANAMRNYTEEYQYDDVGNILKMIHSANGNGSWTRRYHYAEDSNRLLATNLPGDGDEDDNPFSAEYKYDTHGNMIKMPHLPVMEWDFEDQLHMVDRNGGGKAWYVYDAAGERVRKVVEKNNGSLIEERIYLGGFEIFRKRTNGNITLERETLHIMDDTQRIAMIETKTIDTGNDPSPTQLIRYQFGNHLGSASLELDDGGKVISYEEYYPYGSTSYQAVDKGIKADAKRYRYTGKERDEETGLYYHGARYYASWLGRWTSTDPAGLVDGVTLFAFSINNPIIFIDPNGTSVCNSGDWLCSIGEAIVGESDDPILGGITDALAKRGEGMYEATVGVAEKFVEGDLIGGIKGVNDIVMAPITMGPSLVYGLGKAYVELYDAAIFGDVGEKTERRMAGSATEAILSVADIAAVAGAAKSPPKATPKAPPKPAPKPPPEATGIKGGSYVKEIGTAGRPETLAEPTVASWGEQGGHHIHQAANYGRGRSSATNPNYRKGFTIKDPPNHPVGNAVQTNINRAMHGKTVKRPQIGEVQISATGEGRAAMPAGNPFAADVVAFYTLRGMGYQGGAALRATLQSARQLITSNTKPLKVPTR